MTQPDCNEKAKKSHKARDAQNRFLFRICSDFGIAPNFVNPSACVSEIWKAMHNSSDNGSPGCGHLASTPSGCFDCR
jgi:hypothetical protein